MNNPTLLPQLNLPLQDQLRVSYHAMQRARERFHWKDRTTQRMAERALVHGSVVEPGHRLSDSLTQRLIRDGATHCVVYGEIVYVFATSATKQLIVLKTLYRGSRYLLRKRMKGVHRPFLRPCRKRFPFRNIWLATRSAAAQPEWEYLE